MRSTTPGASPPISAVFTDVDGTHSMPMAAITGRVIVLSNESVLDERQLPDGLPPALIDMIQSHGLDTWLFSSSDWHVGSLDAPRVDHETLGLDQL